MKEETVVLKLVLVICAISIVVIGICIMQGAINKETQARIEALEEAPLEPPKAEEKKTPPPHCKTCGQIAIVPSYIVDGYPKPLMFLCDCEQAEEDKYWIDEGDAEMRNQCPKCGKRDYEGDEAPTIRIKCGECMEAEIEVENKEEAKKAEPKVVAGRKPIRLRRLLWREDIPDPPGFQTLDASPEPWGRYMADTKKQTHIIITEMHEQDNHLYAHFSMAKKKGHMCYQDLVWMKKHLIGPDWPAFQVFPPEQEHVNLHTECLHLWVNLETDLLPDFRHTITHLGKAMEVI